MACNTLIVSGIVIALVVVLAFPLPAVDVRGQMEDGASHRYLLLSRSSTGCVPVFAPGLSPDATGPGPPQRTGPAPLLFGSA